MGALDKRALNQYIYNLSGPSLPPGKTYLVRTTITRSQGVSTHDVKFSLK